MLKHNLELPSLAWQPSRQTRPTSPPPPNMEVGSQRLWCEHDMTRIVEMSTWYVAYDTYKCENITGLQHFIQATGLNYQYYHGRWHKNMCPVLTITRDWKLMRKCCFSQMMKESSIKWNAHHYWLCILLKGGETGHVQGQTQIYPRTTGA